MRRYIAASLAVVMTLSLFACGSKKTEAKIDIAEYKGLEAYESDLKADEQLEEQIKSLCESHKTTETVKKGKVTETDTVDIDYAGTIKVDGEDFAFEGGTSQGYKLDIDQSTFIDGFAEGLVGKQVGKTVTLNLVFPKDYDQTTEGPNKETIKLAGKKVTFKVTINSRDKEIIPEFNDEFVKEYYSAVASSADDFKKYAEKKIQISNFLSAVWTNYSGECMVGSYDSEEKESLIANYNDQSEQMLNYYYQTNLDTYLEACKMTKDDWDKKAEDAVEGSLKEEMIVAKIAEENGLTVKEDAKEFKSLEKAYAQLQGSDVDTLEQTYDKKTIASMLTKQKVQEFIFDSATVKDGERPTTEEDETTTAEETTEAE